MKKRILILVGVVALLGAIGAFVMTQPKAEMDVSKAKAALEINASNIYKSFSDNEVKANELYAGKVLEISGTLQAVDQDEAGNYKVTLDTEGQMGNVVCTLENHSPSTVKTLEIGHPVAVKGVCTGYLFDVIIDKAIIL
ncbi:MAG: hypothetical protein AAGG68_13800 [Bacteroidota bacterium]